MKRVRVLHDQLWFWPNGLWRPPRVSIVKAVRLYADDPRIIALVEELRQMAEREDGGT